MIHEAAQASLRCVLLSGVLLFLVPDGLQAAGNEGGQNAQAETPADASVDAQNNPYFVALLQIGLTKEQIPEFQELIADYAGDRQAAISRAMRSRQANLELRIKQAMRKISEGFVKKMERLLDADQFSRFPPFHEELDRMLADRESLEQDNDEQDIFPRN